MTGEGFGPSIHATAVTVGDLGILIRGKSGSGKSRLALALILAGRSAQIPPVRLVGDDRVFLTPQDQGLTVRPAPGLEGFIEVRGLGIRRCDHISQCELGLVVDLGAADAARLPGPGSLQTAICGVVLPRIPVEAGYDAMPLVLGWLLTGPAGCA